jgi:hypothetical protein
MEENLIEIRGRFANYIYIYQFVTIGKLESRRYDARVESQLTIWMILGVISLVAGPPYHASMAKYLSKSPPLTSFLTSAQFAMAIPSFV